MLLFFMRQQKVIVVFYATVKSEIATENGEIHVCSNKHETCLVWVVIDSLFVHADSEASDQTWQKPNLI